jgi:hypothetical protein
MDDEPTTVLERGLLATSDEVWNLQRLLVGLITSIGGGLTGRVVPSKDAPLVPPTEAAEELGECPQDLGPVRRWRVTQAPRDQRIDDHPDHGQGEHLNQRHRCKIMSGHRRQPDAQDRPH